MQNIRSVFPWNIVAEAYKNLLVVLKKDKWPNT